ncbi:MAG: type IV pilus assembly protein PilX [Candidatus Nitrotoga sp. LAW]|nr:MAG: type IV pilus assembly protein PilX [Candidatus Nitrotoga sp. LAW]
MNISFCVLRKQHGAVFVTAMVLLVVLTLLGITAIKMANLEELMSGNMRDRNLASQAAEMGLRYAEQHIRDNDPATNTPSSIDGITGFDAECTGGYCYYGQNQSAKPIEWVIAQFTDPNHFINYIVGTVFRVDGVDYTAPALPVGVPAPTYLIEGIKKTPPGSSDFSYYYRVTARAQGAKPGTVVWLQEIFRP